MCVGMSPCLDLVSCFTLLWLLSSESSSNTICCHHPDHPAPLELNCSGSEVMCHLTFAFQTLFLCHRLLSLPARTSSFPTPFSPLDLFPHLEQVWIYFLGFSFFILKSFFTLPSRYFFFSFLIFLKVSACL